MHRRLTKYISNNFYITKLQLFSFSGGHHNEVNNNDYHPRKYDRVSLNQTVKAGQRDE